MIDSINKEKSSDLKRGRWLQLVYDMEREDWPYELEDLTKDHEPEIKRYRMGSEE